MDAPWAQMESVSRISIVNFSLGRKDGSGLSVGVVEIDDALPQCLCEKMVRGGDMLWALQVNFEEGH